MEAGLACSRSASLQRQMTSLQVARSHSQPGARSAYQQQQQLSSQQQLQQPSQLANNKVPATPLLRAQSMVHIYRDRENNRTVCTITFGDGSSSSGGSDDTGGGGASGGDVTVSTTARDAPPVVTPRFRLPSVGRGTYKMKPLLGGGRYRVATSLLCGRFSLRNNASNCTKLCKVCVYVAVCVFVFYVTLWSEWHFRTLYKYDMQSLRHKPMRTLSACTCTVCTCIVVYVYIVLFCVVLHDFGLRLSTGVVFVLP